jgi:hypothetical protein
LFVRTEFVYGLFNFEALKMTKCLLKDCSIIHEFGVGFFGLVAIEEKEILLAYYWLKPKARRRRKLKIEMVP